MDIQTINPMFHNLEWISDLNIECDSLMFDTDPFEPQPEAAGTIFPFWVQNGSSAKGFPLYTSSGFYAVCPHERKEHRHLEKETRLDC